MIGDAQPDLIKILLLQIGVNLYFMIKDFQMDFCGKIDVIWKHFQRHSTFRIDPIPWRRPWKETSLSHRTSKWENFIVKWGTPEAKKTSEKTASWTLTMDPSSSRFLWRTLRMWIHIQWPQRIRWRRAVRRTTTGWHSWGRSTKDSQSKRQSWIAIDLRQKGGSWSFRCKSGLHLLELWTMRTYIDPVDIICACRPQLRRVAVLHLILQNGKVLPRPMLLRLYKAIDDYNRYKKREGQRPKLGLHMTEPHLGDCWHPGNSRCSPRTGGKSKAQACSQILCQTECRARSSNIIPFGDLIRINRSSTQAASHTSSWKRRGKRLRWKGWRIRSPWRRLELYWWRKPTTVTSHNLCIGPLMLGDDGCNHCSRLNSMSLRVTSERNMSRLIFFRHNLSTWKSVLRATICSGLSAWSMGGNVRF